jgi:hypothetical protein
VEAPAEVVDLVDVNDADAQGVLFGLAEEGEEEEQR